MNNTITIAIPVYNGEKYLQKALQSIVSQTLKVDQVLICDNNSTDNTLELVNKFSQQNPDIKVNVHVNKSNIGALPNFNKCFELCETRYLLILSVDDRLKNDALEKLIEYHNENPGFAVVAGNIDIINEYEEVKFPAIEQRTVVFDKGQFLELVKETRLWIQVSAALFNMDYIRKIGFWDVTNIGGDERYWAQILQQYRLAIIADSVTYQMAHKEQTGNSEHLRFKDKIGHFEANLRIAEFESNPDRIKKTEKLLKEWIASQSISVSRSVWKNFGKRHLAIKYWLYGLKKMPKYYLNRYVYVKIKKPIKRILNR